MKVFLLSILLSFSAFAEYDRNEIEEQIITELTVQGFSPEKLEVSEPQIYNIAELNDEFWGSIMKEGDQEVAKLKFKNKIGQEDVTFNCSVRITDNKVTLIHGCELEIDRIGGIIYNDGINWNISKEIGINLMP